MVDLVIQIGEPFNLFHDIDGNPLEDGYIYIGQSGLDPISNPITVYSDYALTLPIAQPIRTEGGYPMIGGTPAKIYIPLNMYSITVLNKRGTLIYTDLVVEYSNNISGQNFSSIQAAADSDLSGLDSIRTVSFYDGWALSTNGPAGGALYYKDGTSGIPSMIYTNRSGFFDANGEGFSIAFQEAYNLYQFGAVGDGVADDSAAMNGILAFLKLRTNGIVHATKGKYRFDSTITYTMPNVASGVQVRTKIASLTIQGDGADVTTFYFPDSDGFDITFGSQQHSLHLRECSITTGALGLYTGLRLSNSYAFFGTFVAQSDLTDVTFRSDAGYTDLTYWAIGMHSSNVSDINFYGVNFYASYTAVDGTGLVIEQPGDGCFAPGADNTCGTVYNFSGCNWSFLGTGFIIGAHTQTVQLSNCFFAQCSTSISVPFVANNTLQGLSVSNCTFFAFGTAVNIGSDLPNFIFRGNLVTINDGAYGIFVNNSNNLSIIGNQFIPYGAVNTQVGGIEIASTTAGAIGVIESNTFSSVNQGIILGAGSSFIKVGANNAYTNLSSNVIDLGTNNIADLTHDLNGVRTSNRARGLGYYTGAGGTVTQITNKNTAVTINAMCGRIVTNNSSLGAGATANFTVNNTSSLVTDTIVINSTNGNYSTRVSGNSVGSFIISLTNETGGLLSDAVNINFAILRAVTS